MTNQNNLPVQSLQFQEHPIHVFPFEGRIAFIGQEVGKVLGLKNVSRGIRETKSLEEGVDYVIVPTNSLDLTTKNVARFGHDAPKITILFDSEFFLFVLRSNKSIAVPFIRWVIREAIPLAMEKSKQEPPVVTKEDLKLIELADRHNSSFARQLLFARGFKEATEEKKPALPSPNSKSSRKPPADPDGPTGKETLTGADDFQKDSPTSSDRKEDAHG